MASAMRWSSLYGSRADFFGVVRNLAECGSEAQVSPLIFASRATAYFWFAELFQLSHTQLENFLIRACCPALRCPSAVSNCPDASFLARQFEPAQPSSLFVFTSKNQQSTYAPLMARCPHAGRAMPWPRRLRVSLSEFKTPRRRLPPCRGFKRCPFLAPRSSSTCSLSVNSGP